MSITNLLRRAVAVSAGTAMLMLSLAPGIASAAGEITMSAAAQGSAVLAANGSSTVLTTFSPDLDLASSTSATLEASATSSTKAYYGVRVVSATSSPDVHWEIVIDHATDALASGDVTIREMGTYNATSGQVRGTPATYTTTVVGNNLVLQGNIQHWSIASGEDFTNVDEIVFASGTPLGTYTISRALVNEATDTNFDAPFSFTVNLTAAATSTATTTPDVTAPAAPVVTFPTSPHSTSTNPVNIYGTAEADSSIMITGGASTSTATTTGAGNWSASVNLTASSTNTLLIAATDASGNTSSSTTLMITHASSTATTTPPDTGNNGNGNGGNNGGGGGSSRPGDRNRGISVAASVTPAGTSIAGEAIGLNAFQRFLLPPGQVLGASTFQFASNLRVGSRGPEVTELQRRLTETGYYSGPITGYFGGLTRAALVRFQRAQGLPATGFFGPMTRAIMNS